MFGVGEMSCRSTRYQSTWCTLAQTGSIEGSLAIYRSSCVFLQMMVDGRKPGNETKGPATGDNALLQLEAWRWAEVVRQKHTLRRGRELHS
jgi:hypothetical protein